MVNVGKVVVYDGTTGVDGVDNVGCCPLREMNVKPE